MNVFLTVGTTSFDELVSSIMKRNVLEALHNKGYESIIIQYGKGKFIPNEGVRHGMIVSAFDFKDNIQENLSKADLVISHAGAGSCFETLSLNKPLIAVVNDQLMNNHQSELAEALSEENLCSWCYPKDLESTITHFNTSTLKKYVKGDISKLVDYIDSCFKTKSA